MKNFQWNLQQNATWLSFHYMTLNADTSLSHYIQHQTFSLDTSVILFIFILFSRQFVKLNITHTDSFYSQSGQENFILRKRWKLRVSLEIDEEFKGVFCKDVFYYCWWRWVGELVTVTLRMWDALGMKYIYIYKYTCQGRWQTSTFHLIILTRRRGKKVSFLVYIVAQMVYTSFIVETGRRS